MHQKRSSIRKSRDEDLAAIKKWVKAEDDAGIHGTFWCNWNITERVHKEGNLFVYFDGKKGLPIAYQWGGLLSPGILQIKHDYRGKGIGTRFAKYLMQRARKMDEDILRIECVPSTSIPFWRKMGFTICDDGVNAFQIVERTFTIPSTYQEVPLEIRFYPESVKWKPGTQPLEVHRVIGYRESDHDNVTRFAKRLSFYPHQYNEVRDPVIEIIRSDETLYKDKFKYPQSRSFGVERCKNGWFLDQVIRPEPSIS